MRIRKLHSLAVALCIACWTGTALLKLRSPSAIEILGHDLDAHWAVVIGAFEMAIAVAFVFPATRRAARATALVALALFVANSLLSTGNTCGCLGVLRLDRAAHAALVGMLLSVHGLELALAGGGLRTIGSLLPGLPVADDSRPNSE